VTTASEFLASIVNRDPFKSPSITLATLQRHDGPSDGGSHWAPGIGSYGWGINGTVVTDNTNTKIGLLIGLQVWFSDRRTNPAATPPAWQQFKAADSDSVRVTLTPSGDAVHAHVELLRWKSDFTAHSFMFEPASQQLLFVVPGAGPGAPPAVMVITLHPTGQFGFL